MMTMRRVSCVVFLGLLAAAPLHAGDWPAWRHDAGRTASCDEDLSGNLELLWGRRLRPTEPAWPESQHKLQFDDCHHPVAAGGLAFVASNATDSVAAYRLDTGETVWRFYAEGPVRFAPVVWKKRVLAAADDGCLYCLNAADGELLWRFRAAPRNLRIIGNGRLVSAWPVRCGPVVSDGRVYLAAGIWPFMGIFYYCLDAKTGAVVWSNSGEGSRWTNLPHGGANGFGGLAPQGYPALCGNDLVVPGGRSTPGVFDARDGGFRYFRYDKQGGGGPVYAARGYFFNAGKTYALADGEPLRSLSAAVLGEEAIYRLRGKKLEAFSWDVRTQKIAFKDRRGRREDRTVKDFPPAWSASVAEMDRLFLKAGDRLFAAAGTSVIALDLADGGAKRSWQADCGAVPGSMIAADGKLLVATEDGGMHCFGKKGTGEVKRYALKDRPVPTAPEKWRAAAAKMAAACPVPEGFAVLSAAGSGGLLAALLEESDLHLVVIEPDAKKAAALRSRLDAAGVYGRRAQVLAGAAADYSLAPYLATVVATEHPDPDLLSARLLNAVRPCGGAVWIPAPRETVAAAVQQSGVAGLVVSSEGAWSVVRRPGHPPGADDWTHQYGSAANAVCNDEKRVKLPLGLLWFGGPANDRILPRHGHGPSPQVAAGRLVIEGPAILRAVDIYSGTVLWERELPGIGAYYDNTSHHPGAGGIGANYVTMADGVYVAFGRKCLRLDPDSGATAGEIAFPVEDGAEPPHWGYIGCADDLLIAGLGPVDLGAKPKKNRKTPGNAAADLEPVIDRNAEWRYLAGGTHPGKGWTAADYDDSAWKKGRAGFGYGDNDDRTVLDMRNKYRTVYIRRSFDAGTLAEAKKVALCVNYDDGFVAYLNGREVVRKGVEGAGKAVRRVASHEAKGYDVFPVEHFRSLLHAGKNVIAIEGHNRSLNSSDFTLDPYLAADTGADRQEGPDELTAVPGVNTDVRYAPGSRRLAVFDRHTGKLLWSRAAVYNFRHNAIAAAGSRIYCIDGISAERMESLRRRGFAPATPAALYALDAKTGRVIWETTQDVFGTWLGYSPARDVVVQAGSRYRDRLWDETGRGIVVYRADDGTVVWKDRDVSYNGPLMLHGDTIITNGSKGRGIALLTGKETGWTWRRYYGCNTAIASTHLMTFRSGAAGYCDLAARSGTGNFGGFKSGCTSNLIPAGGVLSAPDYTRTCTCAYQNQSSLALVHMPDAAIWTFGGVESGKGKALNFGAPGNRRGPAGLLWLDYPSVGGEKERSGCAVEGDTRTRRIHHLLVRSGTLPWVAASGIEGARRIDLPLDAGTYTIRLVFAEIAGAKAGERVFGVGLNGTRVLDDLDVVAAAGGNRRSIVKAFTGIRVADTLTVRLEAKKGRALICGLAVEREQE